MDGRTGNPEGPCRGDGGYHRDLQCGARNQLAHLSRLRGPGALRGRLVRGGRLSDVERGAAEHGRVRRVPGRRDEAARDFRRPCRRDPAVSARRPPHGHLADGRELSRHHGDRLGRRAGSGGPRTLARPVRQDPDDDRDRLPVPPRRGAHRPQRRPAHGRELLQHVLWRGAAGGGHQGLRHLDDPLRRAQLQRLDLHRAHHRLQPLGYLFRDHRRHRLAQGPAPWRRQRGGDAHVPRNRRPRHRRAMDARCHRREAAGDGVRPPGLQIGRFAGADDAQLPRGPRRLEGRR